MGGEWSEISDTLEAKAQKLEIRLNLQSSYRQTYPLQ
jgi:hypothetical protein